MTRRALRAGAAGLALCAALAGMTACTADDAETGFVDSGVPIGSFRLVAFDSCDEALAGLRGALSAAVGPHGLSGGRIFAEGGGGLARDATVPQPAAVPGTTAVPQYSGTNTHEAGVDEPDLVKTDGRRIVTVVGGVLRVVDAASRRVVGSVNLAPAGEDFRLAADDLLLAGDHALVLMNGWYAYRGGPMLAEDAVAPGEAAPGKAAPAPKPSGPTDPPPIQGPRLVLVDLAGQPRVLSRMQLDGGLVDARQVGSLARVVVRSSPRITFPYLDNASDARRTETNKKIVAQAGIDAWLPRIEVTTGSDTRRMEIGCDAISRPSTYSGASMLTVLTFDLGAASLDHGRPISLAGDGDIVYSNGPSLYVATDRRWQLQPAAGDAKVDAKPIEPSTEIYRFDTASDGRPRFVAGGAVAGYLVNQYAMSEWEGNLRVATTTGETWAGPGAAAPSESGIHVLTTRGDRLTEIGAVTGMGRGERIYAVRFLGPVGYVVTFRQTDPLYTVDLSDPAKPAVRGELKIPGYSAYLHPAEGSRLIGIGQAATDEGRVTGTQVSLFDVADVADPARIATYTMAGSGSQAEFDPHAFLYWPAERLLAVPLQVYSNVAVPEPVPAPDANGKVVDTAPGGTGSGSTGSATTAPGGATAPGSTPGSGSGTGTASSSGSGVAPATPPDAQVPQVGILVLRITGAGINKVGFLSQPDAAQPDAAQPDAPARAGHPSNARW